MVRHLAAALSGTLLSALLLAASCTQETVVLATIPSTDAGAPVAPVRCTDSCPEGLYCSKTSCGDPAGTCQLPRIDCGQAEPPVCGCDGITYFNDCLRQANGIAASTEGECPLGPSFCGGATNAPCPSGSMCAQLGGFPHGPCPPDAPGTCWVLPPTCPPPSAPDRWDSCMPSSTTCLDTCTAIRAGGAYRRSQSCDAYDAGN